MDKYMETVMKYPIGSRLHLKGEPDNKTHEVQGYEFYNGQGYLLFTDATRIPMETVWTDRPQFTG